MNGPVRGPVPGAVDLAWQIATVERACCCTAKPEVAAVLPPTPGRPHPTDLLLCGHHYRAVKKPLKAAGAVVYDEHGVPTGTDDDAHRRVTGVRRRGARRGRV